MNQSAPRVAALVAAPLLVVAATALVLLPRGGDGPPPPSPDGPAVVILAPADRAVLELGPLVVRASLEDPDGITASELRVGDEEVATAITSGGVEAEVRFDWEPDDSGDFTLLVRARDNGGNWGQAAVTVSIGTGEPPLPPPPTTSPQTTAAITTTTSSTAPPTTLAPSTTVAPTTAPQRPTTTPPPPPTNPPTLPPTAPTTLPPTTLPPTTTLPPATTTTTTTTTVAPTTTSLTTVATTPTGGSDCRGRSGSAFLFFPSNGSSLVPSQPGFVWGYFGCNPVSQVLRLRYSGGGGDIPLAGSTRSYTLGFALPACSDVSWDIVATDSSGDSRGTRASRFTTAGC